MTPFDDVPLIDNHLHPFLRRPHSMPFVRFFTEASDQESLERHARNSLFYHWAIAELADLLGCPPDEGAVLDARAALSAEGYARLIARSANVETLLIDDGYPAEGAESVEAIGVLTGCKAARILRIETLAESLFPASSSAADLAVRLIGAVSTQPRLVALKSIIAYRCGLDVARPRDAEAEEAFDEIRAASGWDAPRLRSKPLLNFLLLNVLEWAAGSGLPVQFHTGYGDRDIDLPLANPALLRPVLENPSLRGLTVILLHAAYPFSREASYLAAAYPGVYVDWSQVNPMLPPRQLQRVLEELLSLAPFTKLLYGSDAWGIPDWIYLAAQAGRTALWEALTGQKNREAIAEHVLRLNAASVYSLSSETHFGAPAYTDRGHPHQEQGGVSP